MSMEASGLEQTLSRRELRARDPERFRLGAADAETTESANESVPEPMLIESVPAPEHQRAAASLPSPAFTLDLPPEPDWSHTADEDSSQTGSTLTGSNPTIGSMSRARVDGWRTIEALPPQLRPTAARTSTPAVWIMVWLPVAHAIVATVLLLLDPQLMRLLTSPSTVAIGDPVVLMLGTLPALVAIGVLFPLLTLALAFADRSQLRAQRMPRTASPWWTLLHPLVYLAVRTAHVTRYAHRGKAPLIAWIVINVGFAVVAPFVIVAVMMIG